MKEAHRGAHPTRRSPWRSRCGDLVTTWIYVVGPVLGALVGVAFEWMLKEPPAAAGTEAAQGTLD